MKKYLLFLLVVTILLSGFSNLKKEKEQEQEQKPNFLVIITDDQTYDAVNALGNKEISTPNIDKLVDEGVNFSHCFNQGSWAGAVCIASRTMLITGQTIYKAPKNYTYLISSMNKKKKKKKIDTNKHTQVELWPEVFSKAGYQTFLTGKWHNSDYAALKAFNKASAIGHGMYESRDSTGAKVQYNRPSEKNNTWSPSDVAFTGHWTPMVKDIIYTEGDTAKIGKEYTVNKHTSELYADKAIDFINSDVKDSDDPFFMYVAFNAPHDPRQSPKEYVDMYPVEEIKIPANYLPEHPFDQGDHTVRDEKLAPFPRTHEAVKTHLSEYYAIITHADHEIGRILEALEKSGKMDNTYVIFTSDHGLAMGKHGLFGKQNQYDHSVRMPLVIAGPGIEKGRKVDNMVYMQSIYATTCQLAGIEVPKTVEFPSIAQLVTGKSDQGGEDVIYGSYKNKQRMVRTDEYKLIYYPHIKKTQLFDIVNDPLEMVDLSENNEYAEVLVDMKSKLSSKRKGLGDFMLNKKNK
ncbi:MAG: sulfatase-like hydrolase/transferase [Bacteroidota bacterium]